MNEEEPRSRSIAAETDHSSIPSTKYGVTKSKLQYLPENKNPMTAGSIEHTYDTLIAKQAKTKTIGHSKVMQKTCCALLDLCFNSPCTLMKLGDPKNLARTWCFKGQSNKAAINKGTRSGSFTELTNLLWKNSPLPSGTEL